MKNVDKNLNPEQPQADNSVQPSSPQAETTRRAAKRLSELLNCRLLTDTESKKLLGESIHTDCMTSGIRQVAK